jgi:hypothetical protein
MSKPSPLAGLVQYAARDLRPLAVKYANTVKADGARYEKELKSRIQRLYAIRPDLATYRKSFFFIPFTETVFHADGTIAKHPEGYWSCDRRHEALLSLCRMPMLRPTWDGDLKVGEDWVERLEGLPNDAVVFVNADDSGTLTRGYEPFPDFDEQEVRDFKGRID